LKWIENKGYNMEKKVEVNAESLEVIKKEVFIEI